MIENMLGFVFFVAMTLLMVGEAIMSANHGSSWGGWLAGACMFGFFAIACLALQEERLRRESVEQGRLPSDYQASGNRWFRKS